MLTGHSSRRAIEITSAYRTNSMNKIAIVAPVHIQVSPEWIDALLGQQEHADIIIVDDSDGKVKLPEDWDVYDYARQKEALGEDLYEQFEQFHKSSACKNFGTWLAYKKGYEIIIVIDSDCIVPPDFVKDHLDALGQSGQGWDNPLHNTGFHSRGFPYSKRNIEKWAHMGLWENELDLYGTDRVGKTEIPEKPACPDLHNVSGFVPLSGMNISFRREAIPYMLFLPNFKQNDYRFSRHDDIWGGYIFEKILHAKNKALSYGQPYVFHDTVVIPEEDAAEEVAMIKFEDEFYKEIDICLGEEAGFATPKEAFEVLGEWFSLVAESSPFADLAPAFNFWADAFK